MIRFDIILVLGYFRSATSYLSIVKYLANRLKVGLIPTPLDPALLSKNQRAQATFLSLCEQFGAEIVHPGTSVMADLMLVQHFPYSEETVAILKGTVSSRRQVGLLTLAMGGVEKFDNFLNSFNIEKVYVPSRRFLDFLLSRRSAVKRYEEVEVVEVGLPFSSYPVFPDFKADYLIAAPTMFSFHTERGKHSFLRAVLQLMQQIPATDRVVYKPHNAMGRDYFTPKAHYVMAKILRRIPGGRQLFSGVTRLAHGALLRHIERINTGMLHLQVLERAVPLQEVTPYSEVSLEAFLPGVGKGVIGGLSNTIWGTLYFGLPFYNCVDPTLLKENGSELMEKSSANLLDLNLQYFGVSYCGGALNGGAQGEGIVTAQDRQGDLLATIQLDLEAAQCSA